MSLLEIIKDRIKKEGPISFHDFMEMCLYYPEVGYYTSANHTIGSNGDYYTSSNVTSGFGAVIARQLKEMWEHLDKREFTVVEFGAGTGGLCRDILDYLKNDHEFYDMLTYCIIEKSPAMQSKEKTILREKVRWLNSINDADGITGCILSNEVIDNFSVHE